MLQLLAEIDPEYAATLHPNNLGRVLRAIELYRTTGKTMTEQRRMSRALPSPYRPVMIGLGFEDRGELYRRIDSRVDEMLAGGLVEEARQFFAQNKSGTAAQAIGIKELLPYFNGEGSLSDCVDRIKRETRRYAKRQMTWFRRDERIMWLNVDGPRAEVLFDDAKEMVRRHIA